MTLKLELDPEIELNLLAQARSRGLSLEAYLDELLRSAAVSATQEEAIADARKLNPQLAEGQTFSECGREGDYSVGRPKGRKSLPELFAESPFRSLDLQFERDPDTGRPFTL